jgi:rsbT co-antagonist protein RsbR
MNCQGELIGVLYMEGDATPEPLLDMVMPLIGTIHST